MKYLLVTFLIISLILVFCLAFFLYKNLPNKNEKLKFTIPILIAFLIGLFCYLIGLHPPTIAFGRFM